MKIPAAQIAWALCLYYEGISFKEICQYMQRTYNSYPSDSTVYGWIERFTKMALEAARGNTPRVSDKWIALLTPTRIGDENVWFWDILDTGSRFMLSSHISPEITREDARAALAEAVQKAGKLPAALLSDRSDAFGKSLQFTFNGRRCRVTVTQALEAAEAQLLEQYRSTFKARTVIMKRFKSSESARNVIAAWPLHYNYFRPHEITTHTTPAYQAGIVTPLKIRVR